MKILLSFAVLVLLAGCSSGNGGGGNSKSEVYKYDYSYNGCETGVQKFSSKKAYCDGLLNDELNDYCARDMRRATWEN